VSTALKKVRKKLDTTTQNAVSKLIETRQASTLRLYQSSMAAS
jgi:hypothetical protein